jgi:hypothetical protein
MANDALPPLVFRADDVFRSLGRGRELAVIEGVGLVERRTVAEADMTAFNEENRLVREARPKGALIAGGTQAHALKVARIPGWARQEIWERTGGPRVNPKGYLLELRRLLAEHPEWATSGYGV